jgi:hypothetical protein
MADLYGETLMLSGTMDLVMDGAKRLMMINDTDKVKQDFKVLMKVGKGDNLFHLDYGLDMVSIVEYNNEKVTLQKIIDAAKKYRFIKEVKGVFISRVDRNENWKVDIVLMTGEEIKLVFGGVGI